MKQFIIKGLIVIVGILLLDFGIGRIGDYLQEHANGGMTKRINDLAVNEKHDIVIFGSSRAFRHYDSPYLSEITGMDVYNAGFDGNGVVLAYGLLTMMIERYSPRLIIYDVVPSFDIYKNDQDNNNVRYISCIKPYFRHESIGELIRQISIKEWLKVHSGLIRYNSCFVTMFLDYFSESNQYPSGFDPVYGVYEVDINEDEKKGKREENYVDSLKIGCIKKIIGMAKKNNIPIIMVVSPIYGVQSDEDFSPLIDICEKSNVPFLNYYSDSNFIYQNKYFKDNRHLNADGARFFSQIIAHDIIDFIGIE